MPHQMATCRRPCGASEPVAFSDGMFRWISPGFFSEKRYPRCTRDAVAGMCYGPD